MLTLWTVTDPAGDPELSCKSVPVLEYVYGVPRVTQKDGPLISAGDAKVRNAVFIGGSIWCAFATSHEDDGTAPGAPATFVASVRWYQLDPVAGRAIQEGSFAVPGVHYCYPAIVPDVHGNAALIVGRSGSSEHVSVHVTARRATDPPSELPPTVVLHEGLTGHNVLDSGGNNRWGDYHGVALDPVDSVTLWLYGAYAKTADKWGTVIGALRI